MSVSLSEALSVYLKMRSESGLKNPDPGSLLERYVAYFVEAGSEYLTWEITRKFLDVRRATRNVRSVNLDQNRIHTFSKWAYSFNKINEVIPKIHLKTNGRRTPIILKPSEVKMLMDELSRADKSDKITAYTTSMMAGLMFSAGLRTGELFSIKNADFDSNSRTLYVRAGKTPNDRIVPLHNNTVEALSKYLRYKRKHFGQFTTNFFISDKGEMKSRYIFQERFNKASVALSLRKSSLVKSHQAKLRPYDLRHSYAVMVLMSSYTQGRNVDEDLSKLSVLMGHNSIDSTYWYIEGIPELLTLAMNRAQL